MLLECFLGYQIYVKIYIHLLIISLSYAFSLAKY